ncbi:hypothetical protein [Aestuariivivens sediminis]|nr:hypothetical protein [Aestuariivivens sediminis]
MRFFIKSYADILTDTVDIPESKPGIHARKAWKILFSAVIPQIPRYQI